MLHGVAALKPKGNLYFLSSLHTHTLTDTYFGYELNLFPKKLAERLSCMTFVYCTTFVTFTTFNLKEYISGNISITVIF